GPRVAAPCVVRAHVECCSSTRCIARARRLGQVAAAVSAVETLCPGQGMVEHDPGALLAGALAAIARARAACEGQVVGVGMADQTETFVLWERDSGRAASPVISWQDQRAEELCRTLASQAAAERITGVTALALAPTFSA